MLGRAYRFVIFVFVRGGLGILFVIAVARVLCGGRSSVFARSRRSCTDVDVRSTLLRSRRRVSGTEGCPSRVSSGSSRRSLKKGVVESCGEVRLRRRFTFICVKKKVSQLSKLETCLW